MAETKTTQPTPDWLPKFKNWAAGRTGFTTDELVEIFAAIFRLTNKDTKALKEQLPKELPKEPAPKPKEPIPAPPQKQPEVKPTLIIARTPYPKWWKDAYVWNIDIDDAGTHVVVPQTPGWRVYIATIVLTVAGETDITFVFGSFPPSGAMDFGGDNEPRGMVIATGNSPIPCGTSGFKIITNGAGVHVGGFITYFYESEKET